MGRTRERLVKRGSAALTGALLGAAALGSLATTPAAAANCPADMTVVSPVVLRASTIARDWNAFDHVMIADPDGYRVAIWYANQNSSFTRLALARFDLDGRMISQEWVNERRDLTKQSPVEIGFDASGRLFAAWSGDPITVAVFNHDGSPDLSYGNKGKVRITPPIITGTELGQVTIHQTERGLVVLDHDHGDSFQISQSGSQVDGPFANPALVVIRERSIVKRANVPFVVSEWGNILYADDTGIRRVDVEGNPVAWWANNGFRPTQDMDSAVNPWAYDADTDVLTFLRRGIEGPHVMARVPQGGGPAIERTNIEGWPLRIAEFEDGTMLGLGSIRATVSVWDVRSGQTIWEENPIDFRAFVAIDDTTIALHYIHIADRTANVAFIEAAPQVANGGRGGLTDQVSRLYLAFGFGEPDAGELAVWRQVLAQGGSTDDIAAELANSPVFQQAYGALDTGGFVSAAYVNVLGRQPTGVESGYWTRTLNSGANRSSLMAELANSNEYAEATGTQELYAEPSEGAARRLYRAYFLRGADHEGLCYWVHTMRNGGPLEVVSDSFAASEEFKLTYGSLNNAEFIDLVYRNVLGRSADAEGRAYWLHLVNGGLSRGMLMLYFSESAEFVLKTDLAR